MKTGKFCNGQKFFWCLRITNPIGEKKENSPLRFQNKFVYDENRFWSSTPTRDRYLVSKCDVIGTLVADRNLCIKQHEKAKQQIGVPFQQKPSIV